MTTRTARRSLAASLLAALLGPVPAAANPVPPPAPAGPADITEVVKAWTARQDRVQSLRFNWTDSITLPKGRISRNRPPGGVEIQGEIPPHDLVFDSPRSLAVDGPRSRYRYVMKHWSGRKNLAYSESADTTFDGTEYKTAATYDPPVVTNDGGVQRAKAHPDLSTLSVRPVVVALRGVSPLYRVYDVAAFEPTGRTVTVGGVRCAELVLESRASGSRSVLLVDPARGYVVVRAASHDQGRLDYQLDVAYAHDPAAGWVPTRWEYTAYDPGGRVYTAGRCVVTRYEVNVPLTDDDLTLSAAPGTFVVDATGSRQVKYVVQPDGRPGKKVPRNAEVSYEELAAAGPDTPPWRSAVTLGAAAVFAGSAGLLGWRMLGRARGRRIEPVAAGGSDNRGGQG
jgi:hypothetical protein